MPRYSRGKWDRIGNIADKNYNATLRRYVNAATKGDMMASMSLWKELDTLYNRAQRSFIALKKHGYEDLESVKNLEAVAQFLKVAEPTNSATALNTPYKVGRMIQGYREFLNAKVHTLAGAEQREEDVIKYVTQRYPELKGSFKTKKQRHEFYTYLNQNRRRIKNVGTGTFDSDIIIDTLIYSRYNENIQPGFKQPTSTEVLKAFKDASEGHGSINVNLKKIGINFADVFRKSR